MEEKRDKIIAACGNDCAACPRYSKEPYVKSKEALEATARLWYKIGYRDHVVTAGEIACRGCSEDNWCRYQIVKCVREKGLKHCGECDKYPCDQIRECFRVTKSFEPSCRAVCTDAEYACISRAFFEKEKNLSENQ